MDYPVGALLYELVLVVQRIGKFIKTIACILEKNKKDGMGVILLYHRFYLF